MTQPASTKTFSFELFPPKTPQGFEKMQTAVKKLSALHPEFFSVTYGAGGSTQDRTFASVNWLRDNDITTAPQNCEPVNFTHTDFDNDNDTDLHDVFLFQSTQMVPPRPVPAVPTPLPPREGPGRVAY